MCVILRESLCIFSFAESPFFSCGFLFPSFAKQVNDPLFLRRISAYLRKLAAFSIYVPNVLFSDYHLPFHFAYSVFLMQEFSLLCYQVYQSFILCLLGFLSNLGRSLYSNTIEKFTFIRSFFIYIFALSLVLIFISGTK